MSYTKLKAKKFWLMISLITLVVVLSLSNSIAQNDFKEEDQCIVCHEDNELMPEGFQEYDVHFQKGISCIGCHGGDPTSDDEDIAMSTENGFTGIPTHKEIPGFCGKCHSHPEYIRKYHPGMATDQESQYYTSIHGELLNKGDENVATCISCHTAHSILPASDPRSTVYAINVPQTCKTCHGNADYMEDYKIPIDQFELYSGSVHGKSLLEDKDVGSPACNDCHGNHGATPPGVSSVSFVCGNCHVNNMNYFRDTEMAVAFEELEIHGCEQCHNYHDVQKTNDEMVGVGDESVCTDCHDEGDEGFNVAKLMHQAITDLVDLNESANSKLTDVKIKGMNDIDIGFLLQESNQKLIESRTLVHTFDTSKVKEKTGEGKVKVLKALNMAEEELDEYFSRRKGFAIATIVFVLFAVALFLKIRDIEKKKV